MPGQAVVTIGTKQWTVSLATTPAELAQGLGGIPSMPAGTGMLFDLGAEQPITVTTEPMLFPIDIVFISSSLAVNGVVENVPPGNLLTGQGRYFLEVNAGEAAGVQAGDPVSILVTAPAVAPLQEQVSNLVSWVITLLSTAMMLGLVRSLVQAVLPGPRGERLLPQTEPKNVQTLLQFLTTAPSSESTESKLLQRFGDAAFDEAYRQGWLTRTPHPSPAKRVVSITLRGREQLRILPQTASKQRPTREDVEVVVWEERDRLHIGIQDKETGEYIIDWWDDEAREMFEQGFFERGPRLKESVLSYAEEMGFLEKGSRFLAQTVGAVDLAHLQHLMNTVTTSELDSVVSRLSFELPALEAPVFWRDKSKKYNMEYLLRWGRRSPHAPRLVERLERISAEKAAYPVKGQVPGTRYMGWEEFTTLPSYPLIERAVSYPHDYRRTCSPMTRDGYVSVDAIYNMSAWAGWKSSSLGEGERRIAEAIYDLRLGDLMRLNKGRRMDQPALFPERMLPYSPQARPLGQEAEVPRLIGLTDRREPPEEVRFFADSCDHCRETLDHTGLQAQLEEVFKAAIVRAKGKGQWQR